MTRKMIALAVLMGLTLFGGGLATGLVAGGRTTTPPSFTLAATPIEVRVPDLRLLGLDQAVQILKSIGLDAGELQARRTSYDQGIVLSQEVRAGSLLHSGQAVSLVLSAGPHPHPVLVQGQRRALVGGTCELEELGRACVGGPLLVPLEHG